MLRQGGGSIVNIGSVLGLKASSAYLASDNAAWTTGTVLTVDGGIMAQ